MIEITEPTQASLLGYESKLEALRSYLTYTDLTIAHEIKRFKNNRWFLQSHGEEAYIEKLAELKKQQKQCLLDESYNTPTVISGLAFELAKNFDDQIVNKITYPKFKEIPYANNLKWPLRYYQNDAIDKLLEAKHAAVALPTGAGKSAIILELAKRIGLKTLIISPSISIAEQLFGVLTYHLGEKNVGFFGDSKKKSNKLITVAMGQSLTKLEPGSQAYEDFSKCQVICYDESHLSSTETFKKVGLELCKDAPYRFALSATQMRNDGSDLLLKGIIGPIVLDLTLEQLVKEGFLAKPNFLIIKAESKSNYASKDSLRMITRHLYENKDVHQKAALLVNKLVKALNHQVLIAVDHVEQFIHLYPYLAHDFRFAHGPITAKKLKAKIPAEYHKSKPHKLLEEFNENKFPILISTQSLGMGSDFTSVNSIVNLQGGKSPIKFSQLIGRGTRKNENKSEFNFIDFDINSNYLMHKYTLDRIELYRSLYNNVRFIDNL